MARWPVISALLAIILADTAVQRACHAYGYVDLEFETWVPEILDVVSSVSGAARSRPGAADLLSSKRRRTARW